MPTRLGSGGIPYTSTSRGSCGLLRAPCRLPVQRLATGVPWLTVGADPDLLCGGFLSMAWSSDREERGRMEVVADQEGCSGGKLAKSIPCPAPCPLPCPTPLAAPAAAATKSRSLWRPAAPPASPSRPVGVPCRPLEPRFDLAASRSSPPRGLWPRRLWCQIQLRRRESCSAAAHPRSVRGSDRRLWALPPVGAGRALNP